MSSSKDMKGFSNQRNSLNLKRKTFVRESMPCWWSQIAAVYYCRPPALIQPSHHHQPPVPPVVFQSNSSFSPAWPGCRISSCSDSWEPWAWVLLSESVTKWGKSFKLKEKIPSWWVFIKLFLSQGWASAKVKSVNKINCR